MSDFELGMRKAIKKHLKGGFFRGVTSIFARSSGKKLKKLHLFKKEFLYNTLIIAFIMKSFPFIKEENRNKYCKNIDDYCKLLKGNYLKLNKYFNKYWRNSELFKFSNLVNNTIINRKNNIVEQFHKKLNHDIKHYHPKYSFLVEKLKKITKEAYNNYVINLHKTQIKEKEFNYLASDVIAFIKKFVGN